jgi:hypothetical protein
MASVATALVTSNFFTLGKAQPGRRNIGVGISGPR